jgi:uncharacterized protein (DUF1778 family)
MPVRKGQKVASRGAKRMREQGYKLVQLWIDPNECGVIEAAARRVGEKVATWVRRVAYHEAQKAIHAATKERR